MNDKFNSKRFINYAKKHYWDNKVIYGVALLAVFLLTVFFGTGGNFTAQYNATELRSATKHISSNFIGVFLCTGAIFSAIFITRSLSNIKGKFLTMNDMLLPVSNQERYIFALLNSTVVSFTLFCLVFCLGASYVESLYLFDVTNQNYFYEGMFGLGDISIKIMDISTYSHKELFSLWDIIFYNDTMEGKELLAFRSFTISVYFYFVSVVMWGTVTFRKHSFVINFLLHVLLILIFSAILKIFIELFINHDPLVGIRPMKILTPNNEIKDTLCYISPLLMTPAVTYFCVVWFKLKNLSIYR